MKKLNNQGFSLVELIIVIAIMAVLIGVLAPTYLGQVKKSKISTDLQNAQELATSIAVKLATDEATGTNVVAGTAYAEVTSTVTGGVAVPAVKTTSGHKFFYYFDGKTVHIAIGASAPSGTSDASDVYPTVKNTVYTDVPDED